MASSTILPIPAPQKDKWSLGGNGYGFTNLGSGSDQVSTVGQTSGETAAVFVQQTVPSTILVCPKDTLYSQQGVEVRVMTMTSDALTPTDTGLTVRLWAPFAVGDDGVPEGALVGAVWWGNFWGLPAPAAPGASQTVTLADASQLTFSGGLFTGAT